MTKALKLSLFSVMLSAGFASSAFASEGIGGVVDPSIYRLMVFVMAIFVGFPLLGLLAYAWVRGWF